MAGGGIPIPTTTIAGGFLTGKKLIFPIALITSLFFLWGFSYGLLDVLNKHFQNVLGITKLESTGLQVMYFGGGYLIFSPIAAEVLKRFGYKICILMGLALYSIGAIMFWPTAHFSSKQNASASFGGFCACTLVIACGLATLETAANSYAVVIGDPRTASPRLQFCQAWNGVASFIGPLIASKAFFSGKNANNLTNVQFVYLGVSCLGVAVAILFTFAKLPEVAEEAKRNNSLVEPEHDLEGREVGQGSIWKEYNMICGFIAQFCYVGAQVTIGAFFINYAVDNAGWAETQASNLLSYALITFTVGRFIATGLATFISSSFIMVIYSVATIVLNAYVCAGKGKGSIGAVMAIYFFMAPMYPTLFTFGTYNLGIHTRRGAGILVMGVAGGAVFSPIQGAIADAANTRISFVVPLVGFLVVLAYSSFHWVQDGFSVLKVKASDEIVAAAGVEGGAVIAKRSMSITEQHYVGEVKN
jgi:FHS family L-fucose permease-like MFS transporter